MNQITLMVLSLSMMLTCLPVSASTGYSLPAPNAPTVNYRTEEHPLGIDLEDPLRFSWIMNSPVRGDYQTAYRIIVSTEGNEGTMWDSGKITSNETLSVPYSGKALTSKTRYSVKVKVWNKDGIESPFSLETFFETAFLSRDEWKASWIGNTEVNFNYVRKEFTVPADKTVAKARAYVTGVGTYVMHMNGQRVGERYLEPMKTYFSGTKSRILYSTYDITENVINGENAVGIMLQPGFLYGGVFKTICEIDITFTDGSTMSVLTDNSWKGYTGGPYIQADYVNGEQYDARLELTGWDTAAFDDSSWTNVTLLSPIKDSYFYNAAGGEVLSDFEGISDWDGYTLNMRFMLQDATDYMSFMFCSPDTNNGYMFQMTQNIIRPHTRVNGKYTLLGHHIMKNNVALVPQTWYTLSVKINGDNIETYIDGILVNTTKDTTFRSGSFAFRHSSVEKSNIDFVSVTDGNNNKIYMDNFSYFNYINGGEMLSDYPSISNWDGYTLSTKFRHNNGVAMASLRLCSDTSNGYMFQLRSNITRPHKMVNGAYSLIGQDNLENDFNISNNTWHILSVKFNGDNIETYIDDTLVHTVNDTTFRSGTFGLRQSPTDDVDYDWLELKSPDGIVVFHDDFNNSDNWQSVSNHQRLVAQKNATVVNTEITPTLIASEDGMLRYDVGRNISGFVDVTFNGNSGDVATITTAEQINDDGTLDRHSYSISGMPEIRSADIYTLKGNGDERYMPEFTSHGFRYFEITAPANVEIKDILVKSIGSDIPVAAEFESSNTLINQMYEGYLWGQRGNTIFFPQGCNNRAERHPWVMDGSVVADAGTMFFNAATFYEKWLDDFKDGDRGNGMGCNVSPGEGPGKDLIWASGTVTVAWDHYNMYGDKTYLEGYYPRAKRFTDVLESWQGADYLIRNTEEHNSLWTDWLAVNNANRADVEVFLNEYYYRCIKSIYNIASVLGKTEDAAHYADLLSKIKTSFNAEFLKDGDYAIAPKDKQAPNAAAIAFGIAPEDQIDLIANNIVEDIIAHDNHLTFGCIGANTMLDALTASGNDDAAFALATQNTYPSWGYMMEEGPGTYWEHWDGRASLNHPFFGGGIGRYAVNDIGGIEATSPTYETIKIKPYTKGGLTFANTTVHSVRGDIVNNWEKVGNNFVMNLTIPCNSEATVYLPVPSSGSYSVKEGSENITETSSSTVDYLRTEEESVVYKIGSGTYTFTVETTEGWDVATPVISDFALSIDETEGKVKATLDYDGPTDQPLIWTVKWYLDDEPVSTGSSFEYNVTAKDVGKTVKAEVYVKVYYDNTTSNVLEGTITIPKNFMKNNICNVLSIVESVTDFANNTLKTQFWSWHNGSDAGNVKNGMFSKEHQDNWYSFYSNQKFGANTVVSADIMSSYTSSTPFIAQYLGIRQASPLVISQGGNTGVWFGFTPNGNVQIGTDNLHVSLISVPTGIDFTTAKNVKITDIGDKIFLSIDEQDVLYIIVGENIYEIFDVYGTSYGTVNNTLANEGNIQFCSWGCISTVDNITIGKAYTAEIFHNGKASTKLSEGLNELKINGTDGGIIILAIYKDSNRLVSLKFGKGTHSITLPAGNFKAKLMVWSDIDNITPCTYSISF